MFSKSSPKTRSSRNQNSNTFSFEKLEDRKLLAGITFSAGVVTVTGTSGDDLIELTDNGNNQSFAVSVNSDPSLTKHYNYINIDQVTVTAGSGNDQVNNTLQITTKIYGQDGDDILLAALPMT